MADEGKFISGSGCRSDTDLSSQGSSGSSHLSDRIHRRGYSHSARDTPAHRCHPDNEEKKGKKATLYPPISTGGTKDGFKAPPQLKDLQDRTRRSVLPSNRENMYRCHLQGHTQRRWHINMSGYIPDPIYHWNTGWSSPHLASLESEREHRKRRLIMVHGSQRIESNPNVTRPSGATETLTFVVTQTSTQNKLQGPLTFPSVKF